MTLFASIITSIKFQLKLNARFLAVSAHRIGVVV